MQKHVELGRSIPPVCRLGLATRGNTHPRAEDVLAALERGVNYWNWCGHDDGMSQAVRQLGPRRGEVALATQLASGGWTRDQMWRELTGALETLGTDYLDVVTLYYVESPQEWEKIVSPAGAIGSLQEARDQGLIRAIGLTTHQRNLAARWVQTGMLDTLMVRYNAAHRGAEDDVFPVTDRMSLPTICFTCLRWGALQKPTPADPPDFAVPGAPTWYRFVLSNPSVAIALMAPDDRAELEENLGLLDNWHSLSPAERRELCAHGDRVRDSAGRFP